MGSNLIATHRLDHLDDLIEQLARRGFRICVGSIGGKLHQPVLARRKTGRTSAAMFAAGLTRERQLDGRLAKSVKSELGQTETNRHVRFTSGFTPITDINLGQIARMRLGGQT